MGQGRERDLGADRGCGGGKERERGGAERGRQQGKLRTETGTEVKMRERREEGNLGWRREAVGSETLGDTTLRGCALETRMLLTGPHLEAGRTSPGPWSWLVGELGEATRLQ